MPFLLVFLLLVIALLVADRFGILREHSEPPTVPSPPPPQSPPPRPGVQRLDVVATGIEVFSDVLLPGRLYEVSVAGTCKHQCPDWSEFDGVYAQDESRNFSVRHFRLLIDETPLLQFDDFIEDRATHEYKTWIEGIGKRVAFRIKDGHSRITGNFDIEIELMPLGTRSPVQLRHEQEEKERTIKLERSLAEQKVEQENRRAAELDRKINELQRHVHQNRNYLEADFRREFVSKNSAALLTNLRQEWTHEYNAVFDDAELVTKLKALAPVVLEWYEFRLGMILEAERAQVVPTSSEVKAPAPAPNRRITASTMTHVSECIQDLFRFTDIFDRENQALALDKNEQQHEAKLSRAVAGMAYCYKDLERFGIDADSPEAAEIQFFQLCPPPAPTVYEELIQKLKKRKAVPPDALCERLEDLHREKIILQARRRASIRQGDDGERDDIDRRLENVRREATEIKAFLEAIKVPVEFKDRHEREQELSMEEKFIRLYSGKKRVIDYLTKEGDPQTVENVEALYAQEQARLFEQDSSYA